MLLLFLNYLTYFSFLSWEGELLNLTWNDTRSDEEKIPNTIWQWDDATWVMSACFIIFGTYKLQFIVHCYFASK